jgi:hypothetical protein
MEFYYVRIDETKYWNREFVSRLGEGAKIIGVYAYDASEHTHCCEAMPSYWLEFLGSEIKGVRDLSEDEREEVDTYLYEGDEDSSHYQHCSRVKGAPVPCEAETLEDVREYWNSNSGAFNE